MDMAMAMAKATGGERRRVSSGSPFEELGGYCRAVKVGNAIHVAGTAAYRDGTLVAPYDPGEQTRVILEIIGEALAELGASFDDAVRYRAYVTDISRWNEVIPQFGRAFATSRPAGTLVEVSALIEPGAVVEIEVDAVVG